MHSIYRPSILSRHAFWLRSCLTAFVLGAFSRLPSQAVDVPGVLYAWGDNTEHQISIPSNLGRVIGISAGRAHCLAIKPDGSIVTWGDNAPAITGSLPRISQVAAGFYHSVALGTNGLVYSWGDEPLLKTPAGLNSVVAIAAGEQHTMALRANGTVVVWGVNSSGQLNIPSNLSGVIAIAAGDNHCLALLSNGRVVCWGDNRSFQAPASVAINATAIAAGSAHSAAILSDGSIKVWGDFTLGQYQVPSNLGRVSQIAAGGNCVLVITTNRTIRGWGESGSSLLNIPASLPNAFRMEVGLNHALAIQVDPPVIQTQPAGADLLIGSPVTFSVTVTGSEPLTYQWIMAGTNLPGATSSSLTINSVKASDVGAYSVLISNGAGSVQSSDAVLTVRIPPTITKDPDSLTVGEGKPASFKVTATGPNLTYRWRQNGTPLPFGLFSTYSIGSAKLTDIGSYSVVVSNSFGVVTSQVATLIVKPIPVITRQPGSTEVFPGLPASFSVEASNAESYQWYRESQIVEGATSASLTINPTSPANLGGYFVRVSNPWGSVDSDTVSLTFTPVASFSELFGWGETDVWNGSAFINVLPPAGLAGIKLFAAGARHGLAYRNSGVLIGWGDNSNGEINIPPNLEPLVAVAAGDGFSVALQSSGTVRAWGRSDGGRSAVPAGLSQVIAVAAGFSHTLALRADGTMSGWGTASDGESAIPPNIGKAKAIAAGNAFNIVVLQNSTVTGWGRNDSGQRRPPAGLSNVVAVAAGRAHALALREDGTIRAWGDNSSGQTTVPPLSAKAIAIAAGADHSMALLANNQVVVWGSNNSGQTDLPLDAQPALGISAFGDHCVVNRRPGLKFASAQINNGRLTIVLKSANGAAIEAARVPKISLLRTDNPSLPLEDWITGATLTLVNGELRHVEILSSSSAPYRFFQAVELP